jgi:hypothetical protein
VLHARTRCLVLGGLLVAGRVLTAQTGVTVRGIVYDSVRHAPLSGAAVSLMGSSRTVLADSGGWFRFDGITPGNHTFVAQHDSLDVIGLTGLTTRAAVTDGQAPITLAVPSFRTFWRLTCGDRPAPSDSGLIYGTVHTTDERTPAGVSVDVAWVDLKVSASMAMTQKRWRSSAISDERGGYALCGVPVSSNLRISANADSVASGLIDLPVRTVQVQRHDLMLGPIADAPAAQRGTVVGTLLNERGLPFPDARVQMDGAPEVRSDARGRFVIRDVPAGTRQMEILALGMLPVVAALHVYPRDTVSYSTTLRKVTTLDVVNVTASARQRNAFRQIEERKRSSMGYVRDSTAFNGNGTMAGLFSAFPSVNVERIRGSRFWLSLPGTRATRCAAVLFIDGIFERDFESLNFFLPEEIAVVEFLPSRGNRGGRGLSPIHEYAD